ncbi:MAG: SurA N-terminal domain-containing protein [Candidatus Omnitrophica bacterium]|nr:SurA N-terminal domain-containing protein [Candidatus Omnitrophota bacterium]
MLKLLRHKGFNKKILWAVAIVIILSFGFFGSANYLTRSNQFTHFGEIFGKKISREDFLKAYKNTEIQALLRHGNNYSQVREFLNLESETWDRLILLHKAKRQGIKIPDEEVIETIQKTPFFQRNNQFDSLLYKNILRYSLQITPRAFEESIRDLLTIAELVQQASADVTVTDDEIFKEYKRANEKVRISYLLETPDQHTNAVNVTEKEIQEYYENNKSKFYIPPTVNVDFIKFTFPDMDEENLRAIQTAKAAEEKGTNDPNQPTSKELMDELNEAYEGQKETVREQVHSMYADLIDTPDLNVIAKKNNLDVQSSGYFSFEKPNFQLGWSYDNLKKIFDLEINKIAEPFESNSAMHLVQMKQKRTAYIPEYNEAKEKARTDVQLQKARKITEEKTKEYLSNIMEEMNKSETKDFTKTIKKVGLTLNQTPNFNRGQYLPVVGISKEFQDAAFRLNTEYRISGVVETPKGFCILHLDEYIPINQKKYNEEKENTKKQLLTQKQSDVVTAFLSRLRQQAQLVNNLEKWRQEEAALAAEEEEQEQ